MLALIFAVFIALLLVTILHHLWQRIPRLPRAAGDWAAGGSDDPRVAAAAMMVAVATEDGPLTPEEERHILLLLSSKIGLEPALANTCLTGGKRLSAKLRGDLTSRLHQLMEPIERKCSREEKEDVIDMLHRVAGPSDERMGPVRDGLARLSSSLLHG